MFLALNISVPAYASPETAPAGRFVHLQEGAPIPWPGWCFDQAAMAKIIADKELQGRRCQLKIDEALERAAAEHALKYGELKAKLDYEVNVRQATIDAISKENQKLEEAIIHNDKYGWVAPSAIGAIIGALTMVLFGVF